MIWLIIEEICMQSLEGENAKRKRVKNEVKCANIGYGFLPFAFSSFRELEKDDIALLKRTRKDENGLGYDPDLENLGALSTSVFVQEFKLVRKLISTWMEGVTNHYVQQIHFVLGRVVIDDAQRKCVKYMAMCVAIRYGFLLFSFSSFGELEEDAVTLLKRIRKFSMIQDIGARVAAHIFNRISFGIAKGVETRIVSRISGSSNNSTNNNDMNNNNNNQHHHHHQTRMVDFVSDLAVMMQHNANESSMRLRAPHLGPKRPQVYFDLSPEEKDRYNADIRATNILLQGLPKDIYTLINHYTDAKYIWDNVKMLLEGSKLTKKDQESQLYDDFEHFRQHKRETIHDYYVRFAKLINDMRNIKMTMSRMQLNSKFMNNMLPEWGRFIKLNRGLRDSNYDQLYAYLKQHETHANENKMMLERFSQNTLDPFALMSNVSHPQHHSPSSSTSPSINIPPHLADNAHLDSNGRVVVQNVQGRQNRGQGMNPWGGGAAGYGGVQNRVRNGNPGQARQVKCYNCNGTRHKARNCTQPKRPQNSEYYKDKMLLMQAQENGVALDTEQLLFLAGGQDNAIDDVDEQPVQDLALNVDNVFQADDCDAFDSDVDEAPTAQTMFMANLSSADPVTDEAKPSYDSYILSKYVKENAVPVVHSNVSSVPNDAYMTIYNDMYEPHAQSVSNTSRNTVVENLLTAELATYKEQVKLYERRAKFKLTEREQKINEQLILVISDRNFKEETLKRNFIL
nr:hypothetical protein [Tanacetum cinerariifolium]